MVGKSRVDETLEQLEKGINELFESNKYKQYLNTMSKFHSYSVNNCLLIAMQKPDATLVAGYTTWRDKFHRQVMKGEKGLTIIAPSPYKKRIEQQVMDSDGNPVFDNAGHPLMEQKEHTFNAFRVAKVFDISQTDGEPLPELVSELKDPVEDFDDLLESIKSISPVPMRFDDITSGANGYYSPQNQEIVIKRGMPEEQTLKTLIHEVAHAKLGHGGKDDHLDRRTHEVQAESVAYCTCKSLGLNTEDYSFGYIARWSSGREQKELKASIQTIKDTADKMITGIEQKMESLKIQHQEYALTHSLEVDGPSMKVSM